LKILFCANPTLTTLKNFIPINVLDFLKAPTRKATGLYARDVDATTPCLKENFGGVMDASVIFLKMENGNFKLSREPSPAPGG